MSKLFAIIDLETTGGRADRERIIEIAIAIHDGEKIIDRFESLINPERTIPYNITRITGITTAMVEDAPKFFEVAKKVVEMTEGTIFVAHNVRFDYTFLKYEFQRLGYTYTRKQLCTIKLTRKAFPRIEGGYSLGNLIQHFGISVSDRHRAMADVAATAEVFDHIIHANGSLDFDSLLKEGIKETQLPPNIKMEQIEALPQETGVYYFHNEEGEVVYVGKSIHIRRRVLEHFKKNTNKADKMMRYVRDISFQITGSELVALLLESHEIRKYQPIINKAQRGKGKPSGIISFENSQGYTCFSILKITEKNKNHSSIVASYEKGSHSAMAMFRAKSEFELCDCLLDGKTGKSSCLYHQIGQCLGAGVGEEPLEDYNERALEAKEKLESAYDYDCIIKDIGKNENEIAIVLIEDGKYQGFGYYDTSLGNGTIEELKNAIQLYPNNSNISGIIRNFMASNQNIEIIKLS